MPHVLDPDTGLCTICKKSQIALIKESQKYKRQQYDIRKAAVNQMTRQQDPNYHQITDRHYIKYNDKPKDNYTSFSKKSPFVNDQFDSEDDEIRQIEERSRSKKKVNRVFFSIFPFWKMLNRYWLKVYK